jgi:CTP-dependent riboflavin kinase
MEDTMLLEGLVESGERSASYWLKRFSHVYEEWLGMPIYPGSLNIRLPAPFDWNSPELLPQRRTFSLFPHGGERLIYMVPCAIVTPAPCPAFLWSTTTAAAEVRPLVEVVAGACLRDKLHLEDGPPPSLTAPRPGQGA